MPTNTLSCERNLLCLTAMGDEAAFTALFNSYKNKVYSIAFKITHSHQLAEEVLQDVFLKIWLKRTDLNNIDNFSAYLCTVTKNKVYKVLRHIAQDHKVQLLNDELQTPDISFAPDPILEKENNVILQTAIQRLPPQQKQVYHLMKNLGFKREQVAELLHLKPETIKFHLARAQKNIRVFCMTYHDLFVAPAIYILPYLFF